MKLLKGKKIMLWKRALPLVFHDYALDRPASLSVRHFLSFPLLSWALVDSNAIITTTV